MKTLLPQKKNTLIKNYIKCLQIASTFSFKSLLDFILNIMDLPMVWVFFRVIAEAKLYHHLYNLVMISLNWLALRHILFFVTKICECFFHGLLKVCRGMFKGHVFHRTIFRYVSVVFNLCVDLSFSRFRKALIRTLCINDLDQGFCLFSRTGIS